jgi:hypothetical protein
MGDNVDESLDPETERELRDTMSDATLDMWKDGAAGVADYMHSVYSAFREKGFSRKQAFSLCVLLFQKMLANG